MSSGPRPWWKAVVTYPPTWAAGGLLVLLGVVFVARFDPPTPMIIAGAVAGGLAVVCWPLVMSMTGVLAVRQFAVRDEDALESEEMASLAQELSALDDTQPFEQMVALGQKRAALLKVLDRRLDRNELTYSRYLSTSQEVYRSALDNLHEVAVATDSLRSIDAGYIDRRLAELDRADSDSESKQRERETLTKRAELRDDQVARIERLLSQNEAALTTLDRTTSALADVPVGQRLEDADDALAALEDLADRARMYALGDGE